MRFLSREFRLKRVLAGFGVLVLLLALLCSYSVFVETQWTRVVHLSLSDSPSLKLVHISDLHHKGNQSRLDKVVRLVNGMEPDLVCFTGDLVEDGRYLSPALTALEQVRAPVFAVPGNWEHWAGTDLSLVSDSCAKTGGALLVNSSAEFRNGWAIVGIDNASTGNAVVNKAFAAVEPDDKVIFLTHCPAGVEMLEDRRVALALAGHSHGGQVRLPVVGPLRLPPGVGRYDRGYFDTPNGPLYVNPGIGTWLVPVRFLCRPEITVICL
jgi:predicted MPP superfamily phosphohydrolase